MDQPSAPAAVPTRCISLEYHLYVARGRTREKYVLLRPVELSIIDAAPSDQRYADTGVRVSPSGTIYRGGRLLSGTSEEQVRHATADGFELEHVLTPGGRVLSRKLVSAGA